MIPPLWEKAKSNKEPLDESEREEWKSGLKKKSGLKLNIQGLPWWSSGEDSKLPMQGAWIWSLVISPTFWAWAGKALKRVCLIESAPSCRLRKPLATNHKDLWTGSGPDAQSVSASVC